MIKSSNEVHAASTLETTSSLNSKPISKKNKKSRVTITEKSLEIKSYKDLCSRKVSINTHDKSMKAFLTRTALKDYVFENEGGKINIYQLEFPEKHVGDDAMPLELEQVYKELSQLHLYIQEETQVNSDSFEEHKHLIKEAIIELTSMKQKIITIWNKHNPNTPYKYGRKLDSEINRFADAMLDFIQTQLYIYYSKINDYTNKIIIINQLIEQKSYKCFSIFSSIFMKNIKRYDKPDDIDFIDILTKYTEIAKFYKKNSSFKNGYKNNQMAVIASIMKLYLDKTCLDYYRLITDKDLIDKFLVIVNIFSCYYRGNKNYTSRIRDLSVGIDLYYKNIDIPLFKGIHTTLLTNKGIAFANDFTNLIQELLTANIMNCEEKIKLSKSKTKSDLYETIYIQKIKQQIEELFISYNIPTTDINSWYNTFMEVDFNEIFVYISVDCTIALAKWVDFTIKSGETSPKNIEIKDNITKWLDILEKDYKHLANDTREWDGCPKIILELFYQYLLNSSLEFTFSGPLMFKNEDLAVLHAKIGQSCSPFLGTALLAIAHKDSYDELLSDMDMLEFISQQTNRTKYVNSSKYLIAQIITYLLDKNDKLTLDKKQYLFNKAEKLYLELANLGINKAYLLLAETTTYLAKAKMHSEDFLEATRLYDQASSYCNILSEVDGLEAELQDLAIINLNCFSAEADILRKINEEQQSLLQELTSPTVKAIAKNKKKSRKKITDRVKANEPQELAKELTTEEVINWHQAYKPIASKPKKKTTKVTIIEATSSSPTRDEINSKRDFWRLIKELHMSDASLEKSYNLIEKLIQCDYFNMLVAKIKKGTTGENIESILLLYQNMAYFHFLQQKYAKEIGKHMRLFHVSESSIKGASKAQEADFANISSEAEYLIRQIISLICPDIPDVKTKNLRELILSLSSDNYGISPHKRRLAATVSTYGHLISLDDFAQGRRGDDRLAAKLYDKADEINPNRVIKKLEKKVA
jgi:hypothetical protein